MGEPPLLRARGRNQQVGPTPVMIRGRPTRGHLSRVRTSDGGGMREYLSGTRQTSRMTPFWWAYVTGFPSGTRWESAAPWRRHVRPRPTRAARGRTAGTAEDRPRRPRRATARARASDCAGGRRSCATWPRRRNCVRGSRHAVPGSPGSATPPPAPTCRRTRPDDHVGDKIRRKNAVQSPLGLPRSPLWPRRARTAVDFAVVAYLEDGCWRAASLASTAARDLDTLVRTLRQQQGDRGALGLVSVDDDFFVLVRVNGIDVRYLLSDVTAATEWPLARASSTSWRCRFPTRRRGAGAAGRRPDDRCRPRHGGHGDGCAV